MRPVSEWEEVDLRALIDARTQESTVLEFKQSAKLNRQNDGRLGLSKMVSSLANAAGGILIFGIVEDKHFAVDLDAGFDPNEITKETVDQLISTTIQPRIDGYVVRQIWLEGDREGRVAYAIEVPQATTRAPHQALDHKYYKRSNFESVPMADYEIRDALRRGATPELDLTVKLMPERPTSDGVVFGVALAAQNHGAEPALYWIVDIFLDHQLALQGPGTFHETGHEDMTYGAHVYRMRHFSRKFLVPAEMPLFREAPYSLGTIGIEAEISRGYGVGYNITCPGFTTTRRGCLTTIGGRPRIEWI
jgi:hypothetical protein